MNVHERACGIKTSSDGQDLLVAGWVIDGLFLCVHGVCLVWVQLEARAPLGTLRCMPIVTSAGLVMLFAVIRSVNETPNR